MYGQDAKIYVLGPLNPVDMVRDLEVPVPCQNLHQIMIPEEVRILNELITEFGDEAYPVTEGGEPRAFPVTAHVDVNRPEDSHSVLNFGVIETLFQQILPRECEQNNTALWLSSVILHELARSQAFENGNKRTAYLASSLFLVKCQAMAGKEEAYFLILGDEFTDKIAAAAVENISREELYDYLKERATELE